MRNFNYVAVGCLGLLTSCSHSSTPASSAYDVTGTSAERVARVSGIIAKHKSPPTAMHDAYFLEERIGDGRLGPSDYRAFCVVELAPEDVERWRQLLTPLTDTAEFAAPQQHRKWWVTRGAFQKLQFYEPEPLTGRKHGWIGISPETGDIFIFTFTM